MKKQIFVSALALYTLISGQGCATHDEVTAPGPVMIEDIPGADPALDHYIAWIPRSAAQTPTVAMALAHISLGYAKEQVAAEYCSGDWLMDESVIKQVGPLPAIAPEAIGRYPAWYYRIDLQPGFHGCEDASAALLYHAIQQKLPEWIHLERAITTRHDGKAALLD